MDTSSIQKRIEILEQMQRELRTLTDMLKDTLQNDPDFAKAEEEKSKIKEETTVAKNKAMEKKEVKNMLESIKEKKDEIKEAQDTLSLELIEYYRVNSALTIEDADGKVRELKISVRLSSPK